MRKLTFLVVLLMLLSLFSAVYGGEEEEVSEVTAESMYGNYEGVTINVAILGGMQPITYSKAAEDFQDRPIAS